MKAEVGERGKGQREVGNGRGIEERESTDSMHKRPYETH